MTALAMSYDAHQKDGELVAYPVGAGATVFKGGLVVVSGGYAIPASDTAGVQFVGVAHETAVNTGGAAGAKLVRVHKTGSFISSKAGAVQADVGKQALVVDSGTVSTAATTNNVPAGYVCELISTSLVRVRIDRGVQ